MRQLEAALRPMTLIENPAGKYADELRLFQGIPAVERTAKGRLWAAFYGGDVTENMENFVLALTSDDDGLTWTKRLAVDMPGEAVRPYDPCLWIAPNGALWLFWGQTACINRAGYNPTFDGRCGVWCAVCEDPDAAAPRFGAPRRIANGVMMNKPTVTRDGAWLLPCALWHFLPNAALDLPQERYSNVYASYDEGGSFQLIGHADYADRLIDEHMLVERQDGSLWMLIRARAGIGQAFSYDGGHTWEGESDTGWGGPCSRFFIRRLRSGRLVLVNHADFTGRNNLTAFLSDDDGKTWQGGLRIDSRENVSYPDGTEDDILAGEIRTQGSFLRRVVNKATGREKRII